MRKIEKMWVLKMGDGDVGKKEEVQEMRMKLWEFAFEEKATSFFDLRAGFAWVGGLQWQNSVELQYCTS
jgi:hypothetical protein